MPNWGFVWMVAWPDFRARLRRFLVIGVGMALVLAITLLLSAFSEGFNLRGERLLALFGGDHFVIADGASGPMTSTAPIDAGIVDGLAAQPGVVQAVPLLIAPTAIIVDGQPSSVVVVGVPDGVSWPPIIEGRALGAADEVVVDSELAELDVGAEITIAGRRLTVVGRTEHAEWDIATTGVFVPAETARTALAGGQDVVTAVAITGDAPDVADGLRVASRDDAVADVVARTKDAKRSIDSFKFTLWALAVVIVGAVLYLAALERVGDFAIFKATGASNVDLVLGLALQAALIGVIAGVASIGLAHLMKPLYPGLLSLPFHVAWPVIPVAVVIAVISGFFGVRRAITVDPSEAFG